LDVKTLDEIKRWYNNILQSCDFKIDKIPLINLDNWYFDNETGNLKHNTGKYFSVEGIDVSVDSANKIFWQQPIINQPEVGILGLVTTQYDGKRYFLLQAKIEPGNINILQLSPTVQATESNYTGVHKGKRVPYLEYFLGQTKSEILIDRLLTEQGGRFLRKRNRNIVVEVNPDIELYNNYCWMTLDQVVELLKIDNLISMDTRSVLSVIFSNNSCHTKYSFNTLNQIYNWFTNLKVQCGFSVKRIPLKEVTDWTINDNKIHHNLGNYFSVIGVNVQTIYREIGSWSQPIIKESNIGLIAFLLKTIKGVKHLLVQAKVEVGSIDKIYMAPTVQYSMYGKENDVQNQPKYLNYFINPPKDKIIYNALQSEEGGRFYHSQNRYMAVELDDSEEIKIDENYIWMNYDQIYELIQHNYFNIEARSLIVLLKNKK